MIKIFEFKKKNFWTSSFDIQELNDTLAEFNAQGWQAVSLTANTGVFGGLSSYAILLEKPEDD